MNKLCPLKFNIHPDKIIEVGTHCEEKDCAWWDALAKNCAVTVIAYLGSEGSFYTERQRQKSDPRTLIEKINDGAKKE